MLAGRLEAGGLLVGGEVGVDELDEAVEVFGCHLCGESTMRSQGKKWPERWKGKRGLRKRWGCLYVYTYSLVLLIKVVDISVQDLDEQLD